MEVENITALYPQHSRKYLGGQATEEHAKSLGKDVNYIHFAVHALLDERFPLNSALVLTLPEKVTSNGDNGLLQAWEIFEQVRLDADLVTSISMQHRAWNGIEWRRVAGVNERLPVRRSELDCSVSLERGRFSDNAVDDRVLP
jgi:hypothetical protein